VVAGPKVGFTTTKALGKAVARNRMKRRLREAVRQNLAMLPTDWSIVLNARKATLDGDFSAIEHQIQRLFEKCANS
jgi:ribonuclease P protein component